MPNKYTLSNLQSFIKKGNNIYSLLDALFLVLIGPLLGRIYVILRRRVRIRVGIRMRIRVRIRG